MLDYDVLVIIPIVSVTILDDYFKNVENEIENEDYELV